MVMVLNPNKERKILFLFDDMIADILGNKKCNKSELFLRGRNLNIYFVSIGQSYFSQQKSVKLNSMYSFIVKIPNKRKLLQLAFNHWSDFDSEDFINLYKNVQHMSI